MLLVASCSSTDLRPRGALGASAAGPSSTGRGMSGMPMDGPVTTSTRAPAAAAAPGAIDVYAHTRAGMLSPVVAHDPPLVYVPNLGDGTVTVIDQKTDKVIKTIRVGAEPQHVVPSWDLKTLWVNNNASGTLTPINPATGARGGADVPVADPYNLYYTPDGTKALVMAEAQQAIDVRDPHSFAEIKRINVGPACKGVNHADFSADGSFALVTCEFSGQLIKVDLKTLTVVGHLVFEGGPSAPQDIKMDPYGQVWYVADMDRDGVWEVDANALKIIGFLRTGPETHGLYPSRDGTELYVANRGGQLVKGSALGQHIGNQGSVSVISFRTRRVVATWPIPGGGTPDMGNVNADGTRLWLSGRRSNEVYVFDTTSGALVARIPVGTEPHGLCVWPLPGRYSLGHTGILR